MIRKCCICDVNLIDEIAAKEKGIYFCPECFQKELERIMGYKYEEAA